MSSYGRNFEFRIPPEGAARGGRFSTHASALVIGAPVAVDADAGTDGLGRQYIKYAAQSALALTGANKGILVYEYGPAAFAGDDPFLTTYSDKDTAPAGHGVQVISGDPDAKVLLRNTVARNFLGIRAYPGRVMVSGMGATPTVVVGGFLVPGAGDDVNGYWDPTSTEDGAWLAVTSVDTVRGEVEARMLF